MCPTQRASASTTFYFLTWAVWKGYSVSSLPATGRRCWRLMDGKPTWRKRGLSRDARVGELRLAQRMSGIWPGETWELRRRSVPGPPLFTSMRPMSSISLSEWRRLSRFPRHRTHISLEPLTSHTYKGQRLLGPVLRRACARDISLTRELNSGMGVAGQPESFCSRGLPSTTCCRTRGSRLSMSATIHRRGARDSQDRINARGGKGSASIS